MAEDRFAQIRPYHDDEGARRARPPARESRAGRGDDTPALPALQRPSGALLRPLVGFYLRRQFAGVHDVASFQKVVERYMTAMIQESTSDFTVSGLERLDPACPCLFIGNHRDIVLDPAFVNYALYSGGHDTVRIAIGDNLLTRDYVADLMRLNKSFIVRRSAKAPRQMLAALQELSAYIAHSVLDERAPVWIAQREGRAKDGWDRTDPAIIKMLALAKPRKLSLTAHVIALNVVPVSISYEWDPCDAMKARELYLRTTQGGYTKEGNEDVASIGQSITRPKGAVHVSFGEPLAGEFADPEEVAAEIDRQVLALYRIHDSNLAAYRRLRHQLPAGFGDGSTLVVADAELDARLAALPPEHRPFLLAMYANPLLNRAEFDAEAKA
jgi:1-acyl-sn-glycerol-3-phosphate acyltransferase